MTHYSADEPSNIVYKYGTIFGDFLVVFLDIKTLQVTLTINMSPIASRIVKAHKKQTEGIYLYLN